ncbi:MAG: hypothetical protein ACRCU5_00455, partial [Rhizobiaceae bacterium]
MKIAEIKDVECAILHDSFAPVSGQKLFDIVTLATRSLGLTADLQGEMTGAHSISASCGGLHILVSQNPQPLAQRGFANVLGQPITKVVMPDADSRIARHQANTFITVSKGAHMPQPLLRAVNGVLPGLADSGAAFADFERLKSALTLTHRIAISIIGQVATSAVHWCMSDQLVSPEFMETVG